MEAALLQEYAPRDPLVEVLDGRITLRKLRVMIEHLPPGNANERALYGRWTDTDRLLHHIANATGALLTLTSNVQAAKAKQEQHQFMPIPAPELTEFQRAQQEQELEDAEERVDLLAVLSRAQEAADDAATTT